MDCGKQEEHEVPGLALVKQEIKLEFLDDAFEDYSAEEFGDKVIEQLVALHNVQADTSGSKVSIHQDDHQYQPQIIIKEELDCDISDGSVDEFASLNFTNEVLEPTLRRSSRRRCPRFTAEELQESSDTEDTVCKYRKKMRVQRKSSSFCVCSEHLQQVSTLDSDLLVGDSKKLGLYTIHDKSLKTCNICGRAFNQIQYLEPHHRSLQCGQRYSCEFCERTFKHPSLLKVHVRLHTGERPYICDDCGKSFRVKSNLILHVRTHTGERPFACNVCDKSFTQAAHLRVHMRAHNGDKRFRCEACSSLFIRRYHLKLHMMRMHMGRNQRKM